MSKKASDKKQVAQTKQQAMTVKQMMVKINQNFNIDRIILQFGLSKYQSKSIIEAKPTYKQVQQFFQYLKKNQQELQEQYLKIGAQQELQEKEKEANYQRNKTNIQKFIKDQQDFYVQVLSHHEQNVNQDEKGLNAKKIPDFVKQLLGGKYTKCMLNNQSYFASDFQHNLKQITDNFAIQVKQITRQEFSYDHFFLIEDQILDFLSFWLKDPLNSSLNIFYSRTQNTMNKYLLNYQQKQNLRPKQSEKLSKIQSKGNISQDLSQNKEQLIQQTLLKEMKKTSQLKSLNNNSQINGDILKKYKTGQQNQQNQARQPLHRNFSKQSLSKQQNFLRVLPELYKQICKKRAKLHKGLTFDEYLADKSIMTLQKFINFCNQYGINKHFSRDILMDTFKVHALNRLTANQRVFIQIMNKLIYKDTQIMLLVLDKFREQFGSKQKTKKSIQKNKLSKYSYKLRPVNGMDLQSLQIQLKIRKQQKQQAKQVKKQMLKQQMSYMAKYKAHKKRGKSQSNFTISDRSENSNALISKEDRFDPQNIISNYHDSDKLWDEYEAKIWKKQKPGQNQSILESALSKRIQKGQNVLRKFTQKSFKVYS